MTEQENNLIARNEKAMEQLLKDITEAICRYFDKDIRINEYIKLSERLATVARVKVEGDGQIPSSVIVKHEILKLYPASGAGELTQEFLEEMLAYKFLHTHAKQFHLIPKVYSFEFYGLAVLEDINPTGIQHIDTLEVIIRDLSHTLAGLHASTIGKYDIYEAMREECMLPSMIMDKRRNSLSSYSTRLRLAVDMLKDYCSIMGVMIPKAFDVMINEIEMDITNPGNFYGLIHDDLANGRQVVRREEKLYLIDFENSKYSHILLDICKPLAGKYEIDLNTGYYFLNNPAFPIEFLYRYRSQLEKFMGRNYSDIEWQKQFSSALIYHSLVLIGKMLQVSKDAQLIGNIPSHLIAIIGRMLYLLKGNDVHRSLLNTFEELVGRMCKG
ncbi:MAG: hypothetical protein Q8936_19810 [Bacillota bacterium]|nr:hypothetical protein [Bacillota bacterium]